METNNMITEQNYKSDTSEDEILDAIVELEEYFEEISGALHGLCWNFSHNQEKEAAQKLYSLFIDFIAEYNQADYDVWCCDFDKTGDWPKYVSKYPDRKPMIIAIQKSKLYLPSEIIKGSEELLADMTGTYE